MGVIDNGYVSLGVLKSAVQHTATGDDTLLEAAIAAASRAIDDHVHRFFYVQTTTRYYTARTPSYALIDDLLTVTSLKTDDDGSRGYATVWAAADYDLEPFNARSLKKPYQEVRVTPNGRYSLPVGPVDDYLRRTPQSLGLVGITRGLQIAGSWGFDDSTLSAGTVAGVGIDGVSASLTVSDGTLMGVGDRLLIGTEQLLVTAIASNVLTVQRAWNGTTAAAHAAAVAISRYVAPPAIQQACSIVATRLYARKDSPQGMSSGGDFGTVQFGVAFDREVMHMLSPFRRPSVC